ncbi:hypothetical protein B597_022165 [Stutzerimonas stutzeri KOS6]|uniref:Uncharacterized protein n=1 Tax=Stutzerimonas stutzeri KOS6 TaxID=1218352 RepID=A0A061JKK3_STUST|nr:hypothetical protein B597_022165 [Stutzerimonas stutzeri KOS6]
MPLNSSVGVGFLPQRRRAGLAVRLIVLRNQAGDGAHQATG